MCPCIMNHKNISHINLRKHTVNCKFVIILTKGTCHIIFVITRHIFFSHDCNMVICTIHSRTHQIYCACIYPNIFLMGVFLMNCFCYKAAIRSQHKSSKFCIKSYISHACRHKNLIINFPHTVSNRTDIIRLLIWCIRNSDTA